MATWRLAAVLALGFWPGAAWAKKNPTTQWLQTLEAAPGAAQQQRAVAVLGRLGDARAVEPLLKLFDIRNAKPALSGEIVRALGRLGDARAVEPLTAAWDYLNSLSLRMGRSELPAHLQIMRADIIEALGLVGERQAARLVLEALADEDFLVVARAAEAAGRLKERKALEPLIELLNHGGGVRQAAYEALGELKDERALAVLEKNLKNEDALVQAQAAYALAKMGKKQAEERLRAISEPGSRQSRAGVLAAYYLAKLDEQDGVDYLIAVLKAKDGALRASAVEALGKTGNRKAAAPLAEQLDALDAPLKVIAARGLGQLGGGRAVDALEKLQNDPDYDVRAAARLSLDGLGE